LVIGHLMLVDPTQPDPADHGLNPRNREKSGSDPTQPNPMHEWAHGRPYVGPGHCLKWRL